MVEVGKGIAVGTVPAGAGNTVVSTRAGRLSRLIITSAGTGTGNVLVYDNASDPTGTIVGAIPAAIGVGAPIEFDCPISNGIVVANVAGGPALTVVYT